MEISNQERSNPTLKNPDLTEIENPSPPVVLPGMPGSDYDGAEHHEDYESDCSVITSYSDVEQPTKDSAEGKACVASQSLTQRRLGAAKSTSSNEEANNGS